MSHWSKPSAFLIVVFLVSEENQSRRDSELTGNSLTESWDSRKKIIVELSHKVSEQDTQIQILERKIEEQRSLLARRGSSQGEMAVFDTTGEPSRLDSDEEISTTVVEERLRLRRGWKGDGIRVAEFSAAGRAHDSGTLSAGKTAYTNLTSTVRPKRLSSTANAESRSSDHNDLNCTDDRDSCDDESDDAQKNTRDHRLQIRQISAPKHKPKTQCSDFERIDRLLSGSENGFHVRSTHT